MDLSWKSFEIQQPFWLWDESLRVRDFLAFTVSYRIVTLFAFFTSSCDDKNGKEWKKKSFTYTHNFHLSWFMQKHNIHIESMPRLKIEWDLFWFGLDWLHLMGFCFNSMTRFAKRYFLRMLFKLRALSLSLAFLLLHVRVCVCVCQYSCMSDVRHDSNCFSRFNSVVLTLQFKLGLI